MDQPKRVLVVEDDAHIADLICLHLRDEQFEVVHSADGNEGLRLLGAVFPGVEALFILRHDDGSCEEIATPGFAAALRYEH